MGFGAVVASKMPPKGQICSLLSKMGIWGHPTKALSAILHATEHCSQQIGPMGLANGVLLASLSTFQKSDPPLQAHLIGSDFAWWGHFGTPCFHSWNLPSLPWAPNEGWAVLGAPGAEGMQISKPKG